MSHGIERTWPWGSDAVGVSRQTVVHIVERLAPGGIETLVSDIVAGAQGSMVFSLQGDRQELLADWPALRSISQDIEGFRRNGFDYALIWRLFRALRAANVKSVFLHHLGPLLYGGIAARLAGIPSVIYVEHDAWHYEIPAERFLTHSLLKMLRPGLVAVSGYVAGQLREIAPGKEVIVIPPGIDTQRFTLGNKSVARQRLGLNPAWRVIGSVGRLHPVKGQHFLIRALKELPDNIHAVFVGDGPIRADLEQLTEELALRERVHFAGHRDDLDSIYPAFDVFCLPSLSEGLPRTLLEAQASGVPVVATNVGGIPEAVCRVTGTIVPPADEKILAGALLRALERPTPCDVARSFVLEGMSLKDTMQRYQQLAEA